jgi:hypothetical protein
MAMAEKAKATVPGPHIFGAGEGVAFWGPAKSRKLSIEHEHIFQFS